MTSTTRWAVAEAATHTVLDVVSPASTAPATVWPAVKLRLEALGRG